VRCDVTDQVRNRLGGISRTDLVSDRRGTQMWRVTMISGIQVAVKVAFDGAASLVPAREAAVIRAASKTVGPLVGSVLASGHLVGGGSWTASPWWHGPSLAAQLADARQHPDDASRQRTARRSVAEAAGAIAALHDAGWVHGDIQAAHFIRTGDGVRLLDLASAHSDGIRTPRDLQIPYLGGLVHLEAPEIARRLLDGERVSPTGPGDVYAFAGALWTGWTGTWPVDYEAARVAPAPGDAAAKRQVIVAGAHLRAISSPPWEEYGPLLGRALAPDPDDRPDAWQMATELASLVGMGAAL
jgi:hypothetical protein